MIRFAKAHAGGNDFLIVEEKAVRGHDRAELTRRLCARNTGIGADGVEFFEWTGPKAGRITLHNSDGSIAEIGGNGTRCVAAWLARCWRRLGYDVVAVDADPDANLAGTLGYRGPAITPWAPPKWGRPRPRWASARAWGSAFSSPKPFWNRPAVRLRRSTLAKVARASAYRGRAAKLTAKHLWQGHRRIDAFCAAAYLRNDQGHKR